MSINDVAKKQLPWPPTLYFPMPLTTYLDSLPSDSSLFFVPGLLGSLLITHASSAIVDACTKLDFPPFSHLLDIPIEMSSNLPSFKQQPFIT